MLLYECKQETPQAAEEAGMEFSKALQAEIDATNARVLRKKLDKAYLELLSRGRLIDTMADRIQELARQVEKLKAAR